MAVSGCTLREEGREYRVAQRGVAIRGQWHLAVVNSYASVAALSCKGFKILISNGLGQQRADAVAEQLQMPGTDQTVAAIVARATQHVDAGVRGWGEISVDCACDGLPGEFHELLQGERSSGGVHQLCVDVLRLTLAEEPHHLLLLLAAAAAADAVRPAKRQTSDGRGLCHGSEVHAHKVRKGMPAGSFM